MKKILSSMGYDNKTTFVIRDIFHICDDPSSLDTDVLLMMRADYLPTQKHDETLSLSHDVKTTKKLKNSMVTQPFLKSVGVSMGLATSPSCQKSSFYLTSYILCQNSITNQLRQTTYIGFRISLFTTKRWYVLVVRVGLRVLVSPASLTLLTAAVSLIG